MGFSLLAPLFLAALAAVAVPVLVHLTDRDRRDVQRFPSLKFLTRLPYRQVRRQRIRHPWLFALRVLAVVLLVLAFCRPLIDGWTKGADAEAERATVLALDVSYSMSYGDTWERALTALGDAVAALPPTARGALVTFDETAGVVVAPTIDHAALTAALADLRPGARQTRFAPALELANEILIESDAAREIVLVSDFQANGWDRSLRTQILPGTRLTPIDLTAEAPVNVLIGGVEVQQAEEGTTVTARLVNRGAAAIDQLPVFWAAAGEVLATGLADLAADGSGTVTLGPVAPSPDDRGAGRRPFAVAITDDALTADDTFYLALAPPVVLPVLLVEAADDSPRGDNASLYLRQALAIAEDPSFSVRRLSVREVDAAAIEKAAIVIVHDSPFPGGAVGRALTAHVDAGAGLWVILGRRMDQAPEEMAALLPGTWRDTVDRLDVQGTSFTAVDDDHPIFELFSGPAGGNVAGPRFYRYRPIVLAEGVPALARYADGAVALAERPHGQGRVLLMGSPLDNRWSNLPVQPIFVPLVHQICRYLSGTRPAELWYEVGDVLNVAEVLARTDVDPASLDGSVPPGGSEGGRDSVAVTTPSGASRRLAMDRNMLLNLDEAGIYEIDLGDAGSYPLAVNVKRAESDLTPLDLAAFVAAATSTEEASASSPAVPGRQLSADERERRQAIWWYLVIVAFLLFMAESLWSNMIAGRPSGP